MTDLNLYIEIREAVENLRIWEMRQTVSEETLMLLITELFYLRELSVRLRQCESIRQIGKKELLAKLYLSLRKMQRIIRIN